MSETGTAFQATHEPCGTQVATVLPPGYPEHEGVGLYCPTCDQSFWHIPPPPATLGPDFPPTSVGNPAQAEASAPAAAAAPALAPASAPAAAPAWRRVAPVAAALLLVAAVALIATRNGGDEETERRSPVAQTTPTAQPTPAPPTPTPAPSVTPIETGERTIEFASEDWTPELAEGGGTAIEAPGGAGRVAVSAGAKRGRSLARLGRDARASLEAELPGHRVSPGVRLELNGRRAVRATARRGADAREVTVLAVGDQRFVVVLELARDAPTEVRRAGRRIADSVTIR